MNATAGTIFDAPLDSIDFGWSNGAQARIKNDLFIKGLVTIRDLVSLDRETFMAFDHMAETEKKIVKDYLSLHGLTFGMRFNEPPLVEQPEIRPMDFETWFNAIDPLRLSIREIAQLAYAAGQVSR